MSGSALIYQNGEVHGVGSFGLRSMPHINRTGMLRMSLCEVGRPDIAAWARANGDGNPHLGCLCNRFDKDEEAVWLICKAAHLVYTRRPPLGDSFRWGFSCAEDVFDWAIGHLRSGQWRRTHVDCRRCST